MLELRPYQHEAVDAIYRHLRERDDNPCIVLPTGSGKTYVMATVCRDAVGRWDGRVLILAHVKELLEQTKEKIYRVAPEMGIGTQNTTSPIPNPIAMPISKPESMQSVYKRAC